MEDSINFIKLKTIKGVCMKAFWFLPLVFLCVVAESQQFAVEILSKNAILINADTGVVLFEKNAREKVFPASTTKIATALYTLEKMGKDLEKPFVASAKALAKIDPKIKVAKDYNSPSFLLETDGTDFDLKKGEVLPLKSLLYALMLISGNDCANVIAEGVEGNIPVFMQNLNLYLKNLGCKDTNFCNPHGLHHPNHVTSAYDLALITQKALKIPVFKEVVSTTSYEIPKTNKHEPRTIKLFNRLMVSGKHYYPPAIGVKTGFHAIAHYNLVAAAKKGDRTLIAVLMGSKKAHHRYLDAKKLFERAFSEKKLTKTLFVKNSPFKVKIEDGKELLIASLPKDFVFEYYPSEETGYKAFIKWNDFTLPLEKGTMVGELQLKSENGTILQKESLYAENEVHKKFFSKIRDFCKKLF